MPSLQELLSLIDLLYEGALDATRWQAAITSICRAFGGERGGLFRWDRRTRSLLSLDAVDIDAACQCAYGALATRSDMEPIWNERLHAADNGVVIAEAHAHSQAWRATALFEAWLVPQRMDQSLRGHLKPDPESLAMLALTRSATAKRFSSKDITSIGIIQPHLLRALRIRHRIAGLERDNFEMMSALDLCKERVVIVDAACVIQFTSRTAEQLLNERDGLLAIGSALECDSSNDSRLLRRSVQLAASRGLHADPGCLTIFRRSGRRPLSVLVAPLRGESVTLSATGAVLFVSDPEVGLAAPSSQLRQLYGLTGAEARVAEAVLNCDGLADVALKLGVSLSTVRTLLQRVFEKTDTHRQADLVKLMMAHRVPEQRNGKA